METVRVRMDRRKAPAMAGAPCAEPQVQNAYHTDLFYHSFPATVKRKVGGYGSFSGVFKKKNDGLFLDTLYKKRLCASLVLLLFRLAGRESSPTSCGERRRVAEMLGRGAVDR